MDLENKGFSVSDRRSQPCTTEGGAEEPHSGIFPKVKPRSFIDVVRADELRSVKSTNDEVLKQKNKNIGRRKSSVTGRIGSSESRRINSKYTYSSNGCSGCTNDGS